MELSFTRDRDCMKADGPVRKDAAVRDRNESGGWKWNDALCT